MWGWSKNVPEPFSQSSIEVSNSWIRLRCWIITQQFPLIFNRRAGTSNHCAAAKIEITILLWKTIPFHLIYTANNLSLSTFVSYLTRVLSTEGGPCGRFCFFCWQILILLALIPTHRIVQYVAATLKSSQSVSLCCWEQACWGRPGWRNGDIWQRAEEDGGEKWESERSENRCDSEEVERKQSEN